MEKKLDEKKTFIKPSIDLIKENELVDLYAFAIVNEPAPVFEGGGY